MPGYANVRACWAEAFDPSQQPIIRLLCKIASIEQE
jgi:hypothetical protein